MTIKEISDKHHVSQTTLRYYENIGIISPVTRKNGIRDYQDSDERAIETVLEMRKAGLSLKSIERYLSYKNDGEASRTKRIEILKRERETLMRRKHEIEGYLEHLEWKIRELSESSNN